MPIHVETVLHRGDVLVLVGSPEALREAREQLDPTSPNDRRDLA